MASIRKLPSGSWCVQIRVKRLKPITRTFKTKGNAREFAKQVENDTEIARKLGMPVAKALRYALGCLPSLFSDRMCQACWPALSGLGCLSRDVMRVRLWPECDEAALGLVVDRMTFGLRIRVA